MSTNKSEDQNWSKPLLLFKQRHFRRYWLYLDKMITRIKISFVYFNRGYCRFMFTENVSGVCDLSSDVYFQWQFPCLPQPQCTYNRVKKKKWDIAWRWKKCSSFIGRQTLDSGVLCKGKRKCFGAIVGAYPLDLVELQAKLWERKP